MTFDKQVDDEEEEDNCPICLDSLLLSSSSSTSSHYGRLCRNVVSIKPCNHKYHEDCIHGWLTSSNDNMMCPCCNARNMVCCVCRQHVDSLELVVVIDGGSGGGGVVSSTSLASTFSTSSAAAAELRRRLSTETLENIIQQDLWCDNGFVVHVALEELLHNRIRTNMLTAVDDDDNDNDAESHIVRKLITLGAHVVVIRIMERFRDELLLLRRQVQKKQQQQHHDDDDDDNDCWQRKFAFNTLALMFYFLEYQQWMCHHRLGIVVVDRYLIASGIISMMKIMQVHSSDFRMIHMGLCAVENLLLTWQPMSSSSSSSSSYILDMSLLQAMNHQSVIKFLVWCMANVLRVMLDHDVERAERLEQAAIWTLQSLLQAGGGAAVTNLSSYSRHFCINHNGHDDDEDDTENNLNSGFAVVLAVMNAFPNNTIIQFCGCEIIQRCALTGIVMQTEGRQRWAPHHQQSLTWLGAKKTITRAMNYSGRVRKAAQEAWKSLVAEDIIKKMKKTSIFRDISFQKTILKAIIQIQRCWRKHQRVYGAALIRRHLRERQPLYRAIEIQKWCCFILLIWFVGPLRVLKYLAYFIAFHFVLGAILLGAIIWGGIQVELRGNNILLGNDHAF